VVLEYCGRAFLIGEIDSEKQVVEPDETNNIYATPIILNCANGKLYFSGQKCLKIFSVFVHL